MGRIRAKGVGASAAAYAPWHDGQQYQMSKAMITNTTSMAEISTVNLRTSRFTSSVIRPTSLVRIWGRTGGDHGPLSVTRLDVRARAHGSLRSCECSRPA